MIETVELHRKKKQAAALLKGIFQPIELGSETRLIRSAVIN
jgi:hypothetical protein